MGIDRSAGEIHIVIGCICMYIVCICMYIVCIYMYIVKINICEHKGK